MQLMFSKTMEKRWQEWSAPRLAMVGSLDPVYPMWARYSSTLAVIIGCVGVLSVQFLKEWKTFCKRRKFHTNEIRHYSNLPTFTISAVTPCRSAVALLLSQMCTLNHFEREKVGCGPCVCVCNPFLVAVTALVRMRCIHTLLFSKVFITHEKYRYNWFQARNSPFGENKIHRATSHQDLLSYTARDMNKEGQGEKDS